MKESEYNYYLKHLCIKGKYELLEKYIHLLDEVKNLRQYKTIARERYDKMNKVLMTYMDKYGSLDNKKGKQNGVRK